MQMTSLSERARVTKRQIQNAFAEILYPGDENLVASDDDPEGSEIAAAFAGRDWKEITTEQLRAHGYALPLFTPAAFRYYLPAYMIGCTDAYYDVGAALDGVIFNLTPPPQRSGWEWDHFWTRAQQFDNNQRDAIRSFLELMQQYDRADWASQGKEPPMDRVAPGLAFWTELGP
jgi:hypothetical protein